MGLDWPEVFGTSDRTEVEQYCRTHGLSLRWTSSNTLRTEALRPVLAQHPSSGASVWFNHLAFFNIATLRLSLRTALLNMVGDDQLPTNTTYGDGMPFEGDLLEEIKEAYSAEAFDIVWSPGDVLILDNMMFAHGRRAFAGSREVLVAMSQPFGWADTNGSVRGVGPEREV
jgi:hypothetical protein